MKRADPGSLVTIIGVTVSPSFFFNSFRPPGVLPHSQYKIIER
jgi:hypothetical protein